ncbi:MAG: 17 protein [Chloroflexota bacterium]|nr:17 protein [Chloroflexota bacterium]
MADLLSIQEVAQMTQLHEVTIRRYIRAGKLAAVRIGRRIRVPRAALEQLLQPVGGLATAPGLEQTGQIGEGAVVYQVAGSRHIGSELQAAIGGVALQLAQLPAEDVFSAAQFVSRLRQQRAVSSPPPRTPAEIVAEARRQAALLNGVPRAEIAARFATLAEEIRQQAIAQGTAIEGDLLSDDERSQP